MAHFELETVNALASTSSANWFVIVHDISNAFWKWGKWCPVPILLLPISVLCATMNVLARNRTSMTGQRRCRQRRPPCSHREDAVWDWDDISSKMILATCTNLYCHLHVIHCLYQTITVVVASLTCQYSHVIPYCTAHTTSSWLTAAASGRDARNHTSDTRLSLSALAWYLQKLHALA